MDSVTVDKVEEFILRIANRMTERRWSSGKMLACRSRGGEFDSHPRHKLISILRLLSEVTQPIMSNEYRLLVAGVIDRELELKKRVSLLRCGQ